MAKQLEREMLIDFEEEDSNESLKDSVIFHISVTKASIDEMDFLYNLVRPIFKVECFLEIFEKSVYTTKLKLKPKTPT
jgi:hypothetical protein